MIVNLLCKAKHPIAYACLSKRIKKEVSNCAAKVDFPSEKKTVAAKIDANTEGSNIV